VQNTRELLNCVYSGSVKNEPAGSGFVVYSDNQPFHRRMGPIREVSIDHAELLAVYFLLKWLQSD